MAARFEAALRRWNRRSTASNTNWTKRFRTAESAWGAALVALLLFSGLASFLGPRWWREWRRKARLTRIIRSGASPSDASLLYQRMLELLARRGFQKPAWFTPMEFAGHLPGEEKTRMLEFTELYNSVRFGGDAAATARLVVMLQDFERV
jgi:hypothetical protein